MFIAMNHFNVNPDRSGEFEEIWEGRESYLRDLNGFLQFSLLKGDDPGDYISHTMWESREAFLAWAQSDHFKNAHAQAGPPEGVVEGHPRALFYEAVLVEQGAAAAAG